MYFFHYFKIRALKLTDGITEENETSGKIFDYVIVILILLNTLAIILESVQYLVNKYHFVFNCFELLSVCVFTIEYIIRIWTADLSFPDKSPFKARLKFIFSPMAIIDLMAIAPFYLSLLPGISLLDLRILRMLRLTRLLRILKLARYFIALKLIGKALKDKKEELSVSVFVTFILLIVASTLMYNVEKDAQPDKFPNIVAAFWWSIATLTTVGYGDVYPVTNWGRLLSGIIALLGIGLVALPTGIISSSFIDVIGNKKDKDEKNKPYTYCPHCGKKLNNE